MPSAISISNRLLRALTAEELDLLRPHLEAAPLPQKQMLSKPDTPIGDVYFLEEGMASLVQPLQNGAMIEVGMIGNEGFVGVPEQRPASATAPSGMNSRVCSHSSGL